MIGILKSFAQSGVDKRLSAFALGMNSGLIFALITSTFTAFLYEQKFTVEAIGWLSLRLLPYSLKYFFAPFVESISLRLGAGYLGRRKTWMLSMQILLLAILLAMAGLNILGGHVELICVLSFILAWVASLYDIALEAYRIELFRNSNTAIGNSLVVSGFRLGLLYSGAFALYISVFLAWHWVFLIVALGVVFAMAALLLSEESDSVPEAHEAIKIRGKGWLWNHYWPPIQEMLRMPNAILVLLLVAFYKVSDSFLDTMLTVFLLDIGFSKEDITFVVKTVGIAAFLLGTGMGAYCLTRFSIVKTLFVSECLAALTNLLFVLIARIGANDMLLLITNFIEVFCSAMCNIVLITFMSSLCAKRFTAVHFALLQSISGITRMVFSAISGDTVTSYGWENFFIISALISTPALLCILILAWRRTPQFNLPSNQLKIEHYY